MSRNGNKAIKQMRNKQKKYRAKNRKRPRGWRRGGKPLWAVWLEVENMKREAAE